MGEQSSGGSGLHYTVKDGVAWITFDNPSRLNALRADMWAQIPKVIANAQDSQDVRVVVLRGAGNKSFSTGADISEFDTVRAGAAAQTYNQLNHDAFMALEKISKPTIAMIHGFCLGGGLGLAVSCDLRVCDENATFAVPAARLGIGYHPKWMRSILNTLSAPHAKELLFTGKRFEASWALRCGLVNDVLPVDGLEAEVTKLAGQIRANAPLSLLAAKRSIDAFTANPALQDHSEIEQLVADCFNSDDYKEGRCAFMEKRKPVFKGR